MKNLQLDVTKKITPNHPNDYYISCRCCPNVDNRQTKAVIDLYEPVSDSILKPDLVSWYK